MDLDVFLKYPLIFLIGFAVTYLLVPVVMSIAGYVGLVDTPGHRRVHQKLTPRGGGIAVFLGFHTACAATFFIAVNEPLQGQSNYDWWLNFLCASSLLLLVGIADDAKLLSWFTKLFGQIAAATVLFASGVEVGQVFSITFPPLVNYFITVAWFLAFINAFNLIDGMDGLAAGLATIAAFGIMGVSLLLHTPSNTLVLLGLVGACIAFLKFNFHPARVFLGDSGSMFLGLTLASLGLTTGHKGTVLASIGMPLLAVGVPFFDTILAVWRRSVRVMVSEGESGRRVKLVGGLVQPDMDHLHHRLLKAGLTQRRVALILYGISVALVAVGLLTIVFQRRAVGIFLLAFVLGTYVAVRHLARVELWDSGSAILRGLRRQPTPVLAAVFYPLFDFFALFFSLGFAIVLSHSDFDLTRTKIEWIDSIALWVGIPYIVLIMTQTYSRVWSRARLLEFILLITALFAGTFLSLGISLVLRAEELHLQLIRAVLFFGMGALAISGFRALPRIVQDLMAFFSQRNVEGIAAKRRILIYGAGFGASLFLRSRTAMRTSVLRETKILGFIDDDPNLRGRYVYGFKVLGSWNTLPQIASSLNISDIVISTVLPSEKFNELLKMAERYGIGLSEWIPGQRVLVSRKDGEREGLSSQGIPLRK